MSILSRLRDLREGFANNNFWGGGNAGRALMAESIETAGKDIRYGLEALAKAIETKQSIQTTTVNIPEPPKP